MYKMPEQVKEIFPSTERIPIIESMIGVHLSQLRKLYDGLMGRASVQRFDVWAWSAMDYAIAKAVEAQVRTPLELQEQIARGIEKFSREEIE